MKRPTLSLAVFVAALTTSTFVVGTTVRADGPWKYAAKLNPRTWFQKSDGKSEAKPESEVKTSKDSESVTVTRRHLDSDPFRLETIADSPVVEAGGPSNVVNGRESSAGSSEKVAEASKPKVKAAESTVGRASVKSGASPASKSVKPKNQFVDEFDSDFARLVDSVRAEREVQTEAAPELPDAPSPRSIPKAEVASKPSSAKRTPMSKAPLMPELDADETTAGVTVSASSEKRLPTKTAEVRVSDSVADRKLPAMPGEADSADDDAASGGGLLSDSAPPPTEVAKTTNAKAFEDLVSVGRKEMDTPLARTGRNEVERGTSSVATKPGPVAVSRTEVATSPSPKAKSTSAPSLKTDSVAARSGLKSDESPVRLLSPIDASGLIVSNDQVPDRKLYTATRSFVGSKPQLASSEISRTSITSGEQAKTKSSPIPTAPESPAKEQESAVANVVILPAVKRSIDSPAPAAGSLAGFSGNRVSSNKAPVRVVPDGIAVQRLSHEEVAAAPTESRLPLMSLGAPAKAPSEDGPLFILPGADRGTASATSELAAGTETASAPKLIWPDENLVKQPAKSRSWRWMPGLFLMGVIGVAIGLTIRRNRQLGALADVVAVSSGEKPAP